MNKLHYYSAYLPHKVNLYCPKYSKKVRKLTTGNIDEFVYLNDSYKLILRSLSDLTKEIEINGKKFVPALILWSIDIKEEDDFEIYGTIPEYWKACMKLDFKNDLSYRDMKFLFQWHFDVFGLIEKGLAIDIKTLKLKNIEL